MPLAFVDGRPLFFAHVPKAGGSSVEDYLERRFGPLAWLDRDWERMWRNGGWRTSSLRTSPQHMDAASAMRALPPGTPSFALVREPAARVVSEYRYQSSLVRGRRRLTRLGFSSWLRLGLAAMRQDPTVFDGHLRPQVDFVPEDAKVFRLEEGFDAPIAWIDHLAGASAPTLSVGHVLRSKGPSVPVRDHDLALIARTYAADYARFGYDPPISHERPNFGMAPLSIATALPGRALVGLYRRGRL